MRHRLPPLLILAWAVSGCSDGALRPSHDRSPEHSESTPAVSPRPELQLVVVDEGPEHVTIALRYARPPQAVGPRVIDVSISHDGLTLVSTEPGAALNDADKRLIARPQTDNRVRLTALASENVNEVGPGDIALLHFEHSPGARAVVDITPTGPVFAPGLANQGLLIGDPLHL